MAKHVLGERKEFLIAIEKQRRHASPLDIDPSSIEGARVDRISDHADQAHHVTNPALDVVLIFIVEAKYAQRLPTALVFSDRTPLPVDLDEPDVSARLIGGRVEHQR